jgi:uncharacterized protein YdcH (DUF465 family)
MGAAIIAALQALPALVKEFQLLRESLHKLQDNIIDNKYEKLKAEVNQLTKQIEQASTNEERLKLVRDLNRAGR